MRTRLLIFIAAVAACVALYAAQRAALQIRPAHTGLGATVEGNVTEGGGWYKGEPFETARPVRAWGSWTGSDANTGSVTIGPFPAPALLRFAVGGYPKQSKIPFHAELVATGERVALDVPDVGERWRIAANPLPAAWRGRPVRLVATDNATGLGGWFGVTEPIRGGRGFGLAALLESFAAWAINGLLLGALFAGAWRLLAARSPLPAPWLPLGAAAVTAAVGYAAFWLYFASARAGAAFSVAAVVLGAAAWFRPARVAAPADARRAVRHVLALMGAVGAFYLALLHLFPSAHDFYTLAANRYREALPADNYLPHSFAERLLAGEPPKSAADEWQSSDRPPLQAGWQLLTLPFGKWLEFDRRTVTGTSAVWFQLLWIAGAYGLLRTLGVAPRRTVGWIAVCALAGFFVQNTVFTWPKLSAGAFACGAVALFLFRPPTFATSRTIAAWSAGLAVLAWLSHGGVAFSFLPLVPLALWRAARGEWRHWGLAAAAALLLALPWMAYQKFYDPPGNRLLKWHLGGQEAVDPRGLGQTIREGYAKIGWEKALANKLENGRTLFLGNWSYVAHTGAATRVERRNQEFFHVGRALTWWPILALAALVLSRRRGPAPPRDLLVLGGWLLATAFAWCALLFSAHQAVVHQGSYAMMLGLFVLCGVVLERAGRWWLATLGTLQAVTLATTWAPANLVLGGEPTGLPVVLATALALAGFVGWAFRAEPSDAGASLDDARGPDPQPDIITRTWESLRAWWAAPRLNAWVLAAIALVFFLRRPSTLLAPQLWAEDGSVFLNDQESFGLGAFFSPYMGYIHALPRLVAWLAGTVFDPAWWPACYNGIAFAAWVWTAARLFSPRFALPGKPWLVLAFMVVPHNGEVFFNTTNLQWITAFVIIQQTLIAAPTNTRERIGDLAIVAVTGLTGPFVAAFLPLFAWRWWRARTRDNLWPLLLAAACAAVQAVWVVRYGPKFEFQAEPFKLWETVTVVARRLVIWPLLGRHAADTVPALAVGLGAGGFLAAAVAWFFRPHAQRGLRLHVLAAAALILAAGLYRARPDAWPSDNMDFADRYFYIPRVLLLWLLVWEFQAASRIAAAIARLFFLTVTLLHLPGYTIPAPQNYGWSKHVEPIRRGEPAKIPILPEGWILDYRGRPPERR